MASSVFFVNHKGDEVVSRHFRFVLFFYTLQLYDLNNLHRSDISRSSVDAFRSKVNFAII